MARAVLLCPGEPERAFDVSRPLTVGSGERDDVRLAGGGQRVLLVAPTPGGVLVESILPLTVGGRLVPPGTRRLLRTGERAEADAWAVWPDPAEPAPECTRALVGAVLAGLPVVALTGPGVIVLEGPAAGRRFAITPAGAIVGRSRTADVRIAGPCVSRRHVRLVRRRRGMIARDLGSKNGFTVRHAGPESGRERSVHRGSVSLRPGDEIEVGGTLLVYEGAGLVERAPADRARHRPRPGARHRVAALLASLALLGAAALLAHAAG